MKRKISAKLFFTVLGRGICQAGRFIGQIFGFRDGSRYALIVRRIFTGCCAILMLLITIAALYGFATEIVLEKWIEPRLEETADSDYDRHLSNHILFRYDDRSGYGRICDERRGQVLMKRVDWVVTSDDRESLAVFAKDGKRGYLNRFTGTVAIPPSYTRAWVFSEGLAAVEKEGELLFIDHAGRVVIDRGFQVSGDRPRYAFKNGYCILRNPADGKMGLIDRSGIWALEPAYDNIFNNEGFWQVEKERLAGLFSAELKPLFPAENTAIFICDNVIEVRHADHIARRYDFQGHILVDFVIDEIESLTYETTELRYHDETDEEEYGEEAVPAIANSLRYKVMSGNWEYADRYGLIGRDGRIITQPRYTSVKAIACDRYLCQPDGIIIDDRGNPVN